MAAARRSSSAATPPARRGSRALGALLVGVFDDAGELRYAGKVGTGFDFAEGRAPGELLSERAAPRSPFAGRLPAGLGDIHFVRPDLVVEVRYGEWTGDDRLRHAVYEGVREDKQAEAGPPRAPRPTTPNVPARLVLGVPLSNPGRSLCRTTASPRARPRRVL